MSDIFVCIGVTGCVTPMHTNTQGVFVYVRVNMSGCMCACVYAYVCVCVFYFIYACILIRFSVFL